MPVLIAADLLSKVFLCIEEVDWNSLLISSAVIPPFVFLCIEEVDWNTSLPEPVQGVASLPLYRGSGLKWFMGKNTWIWDSVFLCIEEVDWNTWKSWASLKCHPVFLCIEEVDWNTPNWRIYFPMPVFLCIEEVDWNGFRHQLPPGYAVFLCIEEVDWNIMNMLNAQRNFRLPLYRGSGLKCKTKYAIKRNYGLPLYRGSGLK